ncbi:transcriptional regulator, partial [Acidithiobacillus caldus]|nr:transcriptional regulator [Acidithiobacillus caldus]
LDKVARMVFEDHLDHCLVDVIQDGDADEPIASIKAAFACYFLP